MTTENTYPTFLETAENLESLNNYMSLLNFWHISKINKEREYIKRHGLHPTLTDFVTSNHNGYYKYDYNSFRVNGPSDIQKMVYTVFRIYLEKKFPNFEVSKVRDIPTWVFTINDNDFGLDNPIFLAVNSLRMLNRDNFSVFTLQNLSQERSWGRREYNNKFSIKFSVIESGLLVTQLEKDMTEIERVLINEADQLINNSLRILMGNDTFLENLGIDPKAKAKPVKKKKSDGSDDLVELEVAPTGRVIPPQQPTRTPEIDALVELYRSLGSPMQNAAISDIFNYLVNYLRIANPERRVPPLTTANIREFEMSLRNAA